MARHLKHEVDSLMKVLLELSALVEEGVQNSVRAINDRDEKLAKDVIEGDHEIDLREVEVEECCLKILALHQPVAIDLRFVVSVLKINNDLERIGDLAVNIAERAVFISRAKPIEMPFDFDTMVLKTRNMLRRALDSLVQMDAGIANEVCLSDDEVDDLNRKMYTQIYAEIKKNPNNVESLMQCLSVSRHLERIADYATNIAEDVIYMIEGTIVRHRSEIEE